MTYLLLTYLIISGLLFWLTFVFFAAVIMFRSIRDSGVLATLHWSVMGCVYTALYVGLALDMLLNIFVLSILFLELPREVLSTHRVRRWKYGSGYRKNLALWFCHNFLTPIDPLHCE